MRTSLCSWSGRDDTHPTARTAHPPDWHIQPDAPPQQVTFANAPQRRLMDAGTSLAAPATARQRLGLRPQHQQQALIAQFMDIVKFEAFPEQGKHFRLCHGGRSFAEVDWSRVPSKSNRRSAAFYIARPPLIREEPKKSRLAAAGIVMGRVNQLRVTVST